MKTIPTKKEPKKRATKNNKKFEPEKQTYINKPQYTDSDKITADDLADLYCGDCFYSLIAIIVVILLILILP